MNITKAVIACAGFGTRMLPISKTLQKEMLPILDRPLVDFIVEDCIKAGITEIIFVTNPNNKQLIHYYTENTRVKDFLAQMGKSDRYEKIANLHKKAKFTFVPQPPEVGYGTAIPVKLIEPYIEKDEAFLVFMGDDFIYNADDYSETAAMIKTFQETNSKGLVTCLSKPQEILHKYGVAKTRQENSNLFLTNLIEKPAPGAAPSNLVNISKYIFTSDIFPIIKNQTPNPDSQELYITDSVTTLAQNNPVVIYQPNGEYFDGGYLEGWLKANIKIALKNPELRAEILKFIKE